MFTNETGDISGTVISGCDIPDWNQVVGGKGMMGFHQPKRKDILKVEHIITFWLKTNNTKTSMFIWYNMHHWIMHNEVKSVHYKSIQG